MFLFMGQGVGGRESSHGNDWVSAVRMAIPPIHEKQPAIGKRHLQQNRYHSFSRVPLIRLPKARQPQGMAAAQASGLLTSAERKRRFRMPLMPYCPANAYRDDGK